jgi:hypothetical protein
MAVTTENSTQIDNESATPPVKNDSCDDRGRLRVKRFDFTQGAAAGDATSTQSLIKIPPGKVNVHLALSRIAFSAFGASRVLDIGYTAYTNPDGTAVAADADGIANDIDVSSAGNANPTGIVGGDEIIQFNSKEGVTIYATVAGGTIPAAATLDGCFYISQD